MSIKDKKEMYKDIERYATFLRLPAIRKHFEEEAKESGTRDVSYEEYLLRLLEREHDLRQEHAKQKQDKACRFSV